MATRQAKSIKKKRYWRRTFGQCRDCGNRCAGYRCDTCLASRREAARIWQREYRARKKSN